ncbi:hypothetical protein [Ruania halotolerans]|uniref:hypothetical protein n=1 Tax=Ruania halotolerans TaxID=2897773 RepID=UPI001E3C7713|nr:hypothetical protein [Ruania halotolerans]UFU05187.1 hypothetical protein LQF10_11975 [Ruania halotolerans]
MNVLSLARHLCEPPRRPRSRTATAQSARALTAVLLLTLSAACSVRVDSPPAPIASPSAAEQIRQASALATAELAVLASSAAPSDDDIAAVLDDVAADADAQLEQLGGVWEPPPRPDDDDNASTEAPSTAPSRTADDVLTALSTSSRAAQDAVSDPALDADLATLLAAIVVNRDATAAQLADLLDMPDPAPDPQPQMPAVLTESAAGLCRTLDALGYAGEFIAARSSGDAQERAAGRAVRMRDLAEQVAIAADFDDTDSDPREATYAVGNAEELEETMDTWQADLVAGWLAQIGAADPADRAGLLEYARAAARTAPTAAADPVPGWSG